MLVILPAMMLMGQLDLTTPFNLLVLRVSFGVAQALLLAVSLYMYLAVRRKNNQEKLTVPSDAPSWGATEPAEPQETTIRDYDFGQLRKFAMQVVLGVAICSFIHYKFEIAQPLFIQVVMAPFTLYENPLFRLHVMGSKEESDPQLRRPFQAANPFAGLFGQDTSQPAAPAEAPAQEDEQEEKKEDTKKGPKKSKKQRRAESKEQQNGGDQTDGQSTEEAKKETKKSK